MFDLNNLRLLSKEDIFSRKQVKAAAQAYIESEEIPTYPRGTTYDLVIEDPLGDLYFPKIFLTVPSGNGSEPQHLFGLLRVSFLDEHQRIIIDTMVPEFKCELSTELVDMLVEDYPNI